jgi:NADH-quinone oxidoreductase subunit H
MRPHPGPLSLTAPTVTTMSEALDAVVRVVSVLAAFLVLPLLVGQTEHKVMAHMQGRLGPMYAGGFHGWAQLVADGVKFVQKEDITPAAADRRVFKLAPAVALVPYLVALAAIPIGPGWVAADLDSGLLFVLAASAVGVLGTLMAGWASANKYALLGGLRTAAQLLSYELPIVLAASSVAIAAGTLNLSGIIVNWQWWWILWQGPALVCFLIAGVAELQRPPFDMPVADSEIVFGPYTEYSGLRFAFFLLSEYAGIVLISALTAVLFLGGWRGPLPHELGWLWMLVKTGAIAVGIVWVRIAWPRLREDQLQRLAWLVLVPLALAQLAITSFVVVVT